MKKILLLGLLMVIQSVSAQVISKDNSFASSGKFTISGNNNYWSRMIQNSDGSIYFIYNKINSSGIEKSFLSKLTANGIIDTSFGTNGELELPYISADSQLKKQPDGKLLAFGFYNGGAATTRILPNGQLDNAFGVNGSSTIPELGSDVNDRSYGLILQNEKILVHGVSGPAGQIRHKIYRLNATGSIDSTFGNNGSVLTQGTGSIGSFVLIDNQSNIINLTNSGIMEKFDLNGQPLINFGNNGVLQMSFTLSDFVGTAFMDSNNNIVYSNFNAEINRIKPNGTLDNTFNFDPALLPSSTWIVNIIEKNGYYYIGGTNEDFDRTYFISRLTQNGSVDPVFNYFIETDIALTGIEDMIVNDNNIMASGGGYVVKYLINNVLSTTETIKSNPDISFENPVKQNLVFITKEKVSKIEIYSTDGKIVKTLKDNNTNLAGLLKGTYIAKVTFENGRMIAKKLIKN
ncbi:T9SS type A sorting domain-containing protein [Chryseobacterium lathyri]|uniref:T9SS type A sorting domain-containing protein n=1 Tax=Chryseobacterium lathyri TaxID=395933 RepID=UPI00277DE441|nr:T9SS type A sorting domain-containing protein [Chryseobacterium lathyri]MDQ0065814.1 putative delta-60 repeat protein [Chryseobacterium lathyri]